MAKIRSLRSRAISSLAIGDHLGLPFPISGRQEMRWRFLDLSNARDAALRRYFVNKIDAWWREFADKAADLEAHFSRRIKFDVFGWMATHFQTINSHLMWEYGRATRGPGHRLVITPESRHHLRPLTDTILASAPQLDGWEFYDERLPEDLASAQSTVEARVGGDISDYQVRVSRGEYNTLDLCYVAPSIRDSKDQPARNAAFVATETLLGEHCLNQWIGALDVEPAGNPKNRGRSIGGRNNSGREISLDRLRDTVNSLIGSIRDQLPSVPYHARMNTADWILFELTPEEREDYPAQSDLFVATCQDEELWNAARQGHLFYSKRFSTVGETFVYIKLDRFEVPREMTLDDRGEIEERLNDLLSRDDLGSHLGGGTGLRYFYIYLALTDVEHGVRMIRDLLQRSEVPMRSWIQFFDADLEAEWVGVYDDTPPPPMPEFD